MDCSFFKLVGWLILFFRDKGKGLVVFFPPVNWKTYQSGMPCMSISAQEVFLFLFKIHHSVLDEAFKLLLAHLREHCIFGN